MIIWTEELSVGVDVLDEDHKILVKCVNDFISAVEQGEGIFHVDSIFSILMNYTDYHFTREERIMEACDYHDLARHHQQHQDLKIQLIDMREAYLQTADKEIVGELSVFLSNWLQTHIMKEDFAYRSALEGKSETIARVIKENP